MREGSAGVQTVHALALDAQRFAAGCQDIDLGCAASDVFHHTRRSGHDTLAIVQDEQHCLVLEQRRDTGRWVGREVREAQGKGDRRRHRLVAVERGKIDPLDAVRIGGADAVRDRGGHREIGRAHV